MGFLDFLFARKLKAFEKISLQDLEDAARRKISEREEGFKDEAKSFFDRIKQQKKR